MAISQADLVLTGVVSLEEEESVSLRSLPLNSFSSRAKIRSLYAGRTSKRMSKCVISLILFVQIFLKQDTYGRRHFASFAGLINLGISFLVVYFIALVSLKVFLLLFPSGVFLFNGM